MPKNKPAASRGFLDRADLESGSSRRSQAQNARTKRSKEASVAFGTCWLSLAPLRNAVASPSGHWYSRESILQHILTKKQEIKTLQAAFDEQQENARIQETLEARQKARQLEEEAREMIEGKAGVARLGSAETAANGDDMEKPDGKDQESFEPLDQGGKMEKRRRELVDAQDVSHKRKKVDLRSKQQKLVELSKSSPWLAQFAPEAEANELKEPPKRPPSPITGQPLRSKDLVPFDVEVDDKDSGQALCSLTHKRISIHPAVLIKPSRKVILKSVYDELVKPEMICPFSGVKLKSKDVIDLATNATS